MKTNLITMAVILFSAQALGGEASKYTAEKKISNHYAFNKPSDQQTLYVHNINGYVKVQGYYGDDVQVEVDRLTSANSQSDLSLGVKEAQFDVFQHNDQMHFYVKTPYTKIEIDGGKVKIREQHKYSHSQYHYQLDYVIKVPHNTNLNLQTINNGDIVVKDVQAHFIHANNINGGIDLKQVSGEMDIKTVNGDVQLSYIDNSVEDVNFESVNGDLDVRFVDEPDIEIVYQSMNGEFYSNMELASVSTIVDKSVKTKMRGVKFNIQPKKKIVIGGSNGVNFNFKTLNGDIHLTDQS